MRYLANWSARDIANSLFQKWAIKGFFPAGERSELSRREAWPQWGLGRSPKRPAGRVGGEQSDRQGAMRHRTPRARGQPLRAVCPRNVVRLFRPKGRKWTTRIYSGRPTVRLPQTEAWAERERVPSGHNRRRRLATRSSGKQQAGRTAVRTAPIVCPEESPLVRPQAHTPVPERPDAPTTARLVGLPPRGGSTFFRSERQYQRKLAARRLQRRPAPLRVIRKYRRSGHCRARLLYLLRPASR